MEEACQEVLLKMDQNVSEEGVGLKGNTLLLDNIEHLLQIELIVMVVEEAIGIIAGTMIILQGVIDLQ